MVKLKEVNNIINSAKQQLVELIKKELKNDIIFNQGLSFQSSLNDESECNTFIKPIRLHIENNDLMIEYKLWDVDSVVNDEFDIQLVKMDVKDIISIIELLEEECK